MFYNSKTSLAPLLLLLCLAIVACGKKPTVAPNLNFHLLSDRATDSTITTTFEGREVYLITPPEMSAPLLLGASASFENNGWGISLEFAKPSDSDFARVTTSASNKRLAIVISGKVVTAPMIAMPINGGTCRISGDFTQGEAIKLVEQILADNILKN